MQITQLTFSMAVMYCICLTETHADSIAAYFRDRHYVVTVRQHPRGYIVLLG